MPSLLLTRSHADNLAIAPLFEQRGMVVHSVPLIEFRPIPRDACGMRQVRRLAGSEPVLLTSAYAADLWLDLRESEFREHPPEAYYLVGERSAQLVRESDPGIPIRAVAPSAEELLRDASFEGVERILYPCSTGRLDTLPRGLEERGVEVIELPLYTPAIPAGSGALLREILANAAEPLVIAFFSPSAVSNFFSLTPVIPRNSIFAAIGGTTARALREHGISMVIVPEQPSAEALAGALSGSGDR